MQRLLAGMPYLQSTEWGWEVMEFPEWHPDCGGDWVLSGPGYFANYWQDNTVVASILDGPDGNEIATSGIQPFASKAQCTSYAEWWIRAELTAMKTNGGVTSEQTLVPELVATYHRIAAAAEWIAEDPKGYETTLTLFHDVLSVCGIPVTIDVSRRIRAVAAYVEGDWDGQA